MTRLTQLRITFQNTLNSSHLVHRRYQHTLISNAITYSQPGNPSEVLKLKQILLGPPKHDQLGLKFILSPLNPADINTIQGRYPWKPQKIQDPKNKDDEFYIAGNEGLAEVTSIGHGLDPNHWKIGDWVVMGKPQLGTWRSHANLDAENLIKLPRSSNLTQVQAATLSVNLSTAYRLIKDYLPELSSDTWIIQNGANSSVGQYVLQLCKAWNLGCIGLIRNRPNVDQLKSSLVTLGALNKTHILTYDEMDQHSSLCKSVSIRLGLNCISGNTETVPMMKWMANGSRLITYGGMSMKPLVVPTSLLIFRDLKLEGFMLTNWLMKTSMDNRQEMLREILDLIDGGKLKQQMNVAVVDIDGQSGQHNLNESVLQSINGRSGKKILFRFL